MIHCHVSLPYHLLSVCKHKSDSQMVNTNLIHDGINPYACLNLLWEKPISYFPRFQATANLKDIQESGPKRSGHAPSFNRLLSQFNRLSGSNWIAAAFCAMAVAKANVVNRWERGQVGGECVCAFVYVCVYGRGLRWGMQIRPPLIKGRNALLEATCRNHSARILWRRKFRNEICREGGSRTPRYNLAERGEGGWLADVGCGTRRCLLLRCWSISPASDWPFKDYLGSLQEKLC